METCSVSSNLASVDEILYGDHSKETYLAVLLHGTICFSVFSKMEYGLFVEF